MRFHDVAITLDINGHEVEVSIDLDLDDDLITDAAEDLGMRFGKDAEDLDSIDDALDVALYYVIQAERLLDVAPRGEQERLLSSVRSRLSCVEEAVLSAISQLGGL